MQLLAMIKNVALLEKNDNYHIVVLDLEKEDQNLMWIEQQFCFRNDLKRALKEFLWLTDKETRNRAEFDTEIAEWFKTGNPMEEFTKWTKKYTKGTTNFYLDTYEWAKELNKKYGGIMIK